jgi:predicted transcriptional regulator of viral defense system
MSDVATAGISSENRERLQVLHRQGSKPVTVADASGLWGLEQARSGRLLRSLAAGGWLARVRRGLYVPVPLDSVRSGEWQEDPWILAAKLFPSGYVGGWSAAEYWSLTDQTFRDLCVFTPRRLRTTNVDAGATGIRTRLVSRWNSSGLVGVWRGQTKVTVSDPSRTVVDILDVPAMGGGVRHVAEIVSVYFAGEHRDDEALLRYGHEKHNGALFKRLGYIVETLEVDAPYVIEASLASVTRGVSLLDPGIGRHGQIRTRWNLQINTSISR